MVYLKFLCRSSVKMGEKYSEILVFQRQTNPLGESRIAKKVDFIQIMGTNYMVDCRSPTFHIILTMGNSNQNLGYKKMNQLISHDLIQYRIFSYFPLQSFSEGQNNYVPPFLPHNQSFLKGPLRGVEKEMSHSRLLFRERPHGY